MTIDDYYPLTPLQAGILFHTLAAPASGVYVEQFACRAPGTIDGERWEQAWNAVIAAYPVLRSAIAWEGLPQPLQVIRQDAHLAVMEIDCRGDDEAAFGRRLEVLRREEAARGFDLRKAPLLRQTLLQRDGHSVVFWTYHHVLLDGWSAFVLLGAALAAYGALETGADWAPAPAPTQRQYLEWLQRRDQVAAEAFWRQRLAGFTATTPLGLVEVDEPETDEPGATVTAVFGEALATRLRESARQLRVTVGTLLQAAWGHLLAIYSGEDDVVFGVTVAGRPPELAGSEAMVGLFINTLPTRVRIDPALSVADFVTRLQAELLAQRDHEHASLTAIAQWSQLPAGQPLFDSMLAIETFPAAAGVALADVTVWQQTNFPLAVVVDPGSTMRLKALFDPRRHAPATIAALLDHYRALLAAFCADPAARLGSLEFRPAADAALQAGWNHRPPVGDPHADLAALFQRHATAAPDAPAVCWDEQQVSYGQLARAAADYAARLAGAGVAVHDTVAFVFEPCADMVAALIGITALGAGYAPLDPRLPPQRLAEMVADLGIRHVVAASEYAALFDLPGVTVHLPADWDQLPAAALLSAAPSRRVLYVIHTSGSTGKPKAAGVYHDSFVRFIQWWNAEFALSAADRCLLINKITFDLAQKCVWGALTTGGTLHLAPTRHFDPLLARRLTREQRISWINCTPSMGYAVVEAGADTGDGPAATVAALHSLRLLFLGGEPVDKRRLAGWLLHPDCRTELVNTYGPTECTDLCTTHRFTREEFVRLAQPVTVGKVLPALGVLVLDRFGNRLPLGVTGEVAILGGSVGTGYLNNARLSAEKFLPDRWAAAEGYGPAGSRYYLTGDRGYYRADGTVIVRGRTDFEVKLRGYRIDLDAIAHELRQLPGVHDAVVVVDAERLVAYVVPPDGQDWTAESPAQARATLATRLPEYMVPHIYMGLAALPLNANGKLDRSALPAPVAAVEQRERIAPRDSLEQQLAALWAEVLGRDDFGVTDNFFELGGHSLSITQIFARLPKTFGVRIPLNLLFEQPTVAEQAAALKAAAAAATGTPAPTIKPPARPDRIPLSFAQSRLWFLHQFDPASPAYHVPNALPLAGRAEGPALEQALAWLHARHESLRTRFPQVDGEPAQVIDPPGPVPLPRVDLSGLAEADARARLGELANQMAAEPFDLQQGPVARYLLVQLADSAVLFFTLHHIVTDGWSMDILVRELQCAAFADGRLPEAAPLPLQYADYALWQRQALSGERLEADLAYWRETLDGCDARITLPYDFPRPPSHHVAGRLRVTQIPPALAAEVRRLAEGAGTTEFTAWLAIWNLLLYRWSGQADFNVGTPVANRPYPEIEGLVGFFVNTLVLRSRMAPDQTFAGLLDQTAAGCRQAFAHQELPFELLVDRLNPPRHPAYQPFFQVGFALQRAFENTGLIDPEHWIARFDLQLILHAEPDGGLRAHWEYATALWRPETIDRLAASLPLLAEQVVRDAQQPVAGYTVLSAAEAAQLAAFSQGPAPAQPEPATVTALVEGQARWQPEAPALVNGELRLTYAELNASANQLARLLVEHGVGPENRVAVCLPRGPELIVALLAVLKAGGAYVPLDPDYPAERMTTLLAGSGAALVVSRAGSDTHLPATVPVLLLNESAAALSALPCDNLAACRTWGREGENVLERGQFRANLRHVAGLHNESSPENEPFPAHLQPAHPKSDRLLAPRATADSLAYLLFTSGSTGVPKAVTIPQRAIVRLVVEPSYVQLGADDRVLQFAPVAFDASTFEIWGTLANGACIVQAPAGPVGIDTLAGLIAGQRVTVAFLTTALFHALVDDYPEALAGMRHLLTGGEVLSPDHAARGLAALKGVLTNCYGPTECTTFATAHRITAEDIASGRIPIGRPINHTTARVLDSQLRPVPVGVEGELCLGGLGLARGYENQPALTAERFVDDPLQPGARLYRTGDRARWRPDGTLDFLGRRDFQLKLRGHRIEPGEIEAALCRHPAVAEALVQPIGSGAEQRLVGYVLAPADTCSATDLREHLARLLPAYMVPADYVILDQWPVNANGKIDRSRLPMPDTTPAEACVAPATPTERAVAEVWAELLQRPRISVTADFFHLGGNSLTATQLLARVRNRLGRAPTIPQFFAEPTVRAMARQIDAAVAGVAEDGPQQPVDGAAESQIDLPGYLPPLASALENVLLTGATGYFGAYLLAELLTRWPGVTVHCHVRAPDATTGLRRLRDNLAAYGLWQDAWTPRLRILIGDLAQPRLGLADDDYRRLARDIDLIVHNASLLNHVLRYEALREANVEPTRQLLALGFAEKLKGFVYVSTAGVLRSDGQGRSVDEALVIEDEPQYVHEGYNASKWVAELMVRRAARAGLPAQIARLGRVVVDSQTGAGRLDDFVALFVRTCLRINAYPDYPLAEQIVPVDYLARAVVALAADYTRTAVWHLVGEHRQDWSRLLPEHVDVTQAGLEKLPVQDWVDRVKAHSVHDPLPFAPYLFWWDTDAGAPEEKRLKIRQAATSRALGRLGVNEPRVSRDAWRTYLQKIFAAEGRAFVPRKRLFF